MILFTLKLVGFPEKRKKRCGKSYLLFEIYTDYLLSQGIEKNQIITVSLDDDQNTVYRNPEKLSQHTIVQISD